MVGHKLYWSSLESDQPYPGGESPAAFHHRIEDAFHDLIEPIPSKYPHDRPANDWAVSS